MTEVTVARPYRNPGVLTMRKLNERLPSDRRRRGRLSAGVHLAIAAAMVAGVIGCDKGRALAPVTGRVTYQGKPLRFGTVMFQPANGQPATGPIQPDGTFQLTTRGEGPGAAVGRNKVRVACFESQDPAARPIGSPDERSLGRPLVPEKYLDYDTSGIIADVQPGANAPVVLQLTDD